MPAKLLCVAAGGALGALARYALSHLAYRLAGQTFPWGTLAVNLLGCLCIGVLAGVFRQTRVGEPVQLLLMVGLLGALTTFSTFSLDALRLIEAGRIAAAAAYLTASCALGLALAAAGMALTRL